MRALDRTFFRKTIPLTAAYISDQSQLPTIRQRIAEDLLPDKRFQIRLHVGKATESELLVLRPEVKFDGIRRGILSIAGLCANLCRYLDRLCGDEEVHHGKNSRTGTV
jgi:hypothetical protein